MILWSWWFWRKIDWLGATEKAKPAHGVSHIVDFGPGGTRGIGSVCARNVEGMGVQVILASSFTEVADLFLSLLGHNLQTGKWKQNHKKGQCEITVRGPHHPDSGGSGAQDTTDGDSGMWGPEPGICTRDVAC